MGSKLDALKARLADVTHIGNSMALLGWDQQTQMPHGGAEARAAQLGTLSRIHHEILTADETGKLIEEAAAEINGDEEAAAFVDVARYDYEQAARLPGEFVVRWTRETTLAHEVWAKARAESDFAQFQPKLELLLDLIKEQAELIGYEDHPYDAMLNQYERGMTTARVKEIFDNHRPALVDLIGRIADAQQVDDSVLHKNYPQDKQREFALKMVKAFGFDFDRGYQAESVHPFCTSFSVNDVRMTTRFDENFLNPALFGMMHEAGHGMYEQGVSQSLEGNILANGTSLGVHESQSRMWENIVGRSRAFWSWALPQLKETFPSQLEGVDLDTFYRAINKVERSFIRVEADEATYNLHIILRFELEQDMITGKLAIKDLPDAWNSKFQQMFGITPPDDAKGVLQDVHWSAGLFGYFPTYALGNLLSVQYYNQALKAHPSIADEIGEGKFDTLLKWLNENIHSYGRMYTGEELTQKVTGESIQSQDYMKYLNAKFSDIYGV